jgi:hypothetical protein
MTGARALPIAVLVAVLAGVAVGASVASGRANGTAERSARGACTAGATKALVRAFVRGYDRGQIGAVIRMWAPAPRFQWFSTGPPGARLGERARDRRTLVTYFQTRVRAGERIRLTLLGAGYDPVRDVVNFGGRLVRTAEDIRFRGPQDFKGAADCVSGRPLLIVWSM